MKKSFQTDFNHDKSCVCKMYSLFDICKDKFCDKIESIFVALPVTFLLEPYPSSIQGPESDPVGFGVALS